MSDPVDSDRNREHDLEPEWDPSVHRLPVWATISEATQAIAKEWKTLLKAIAVPALLKIDVQGAIEVMRLRPDAVTVFILPPSTEELERRIRGRGTDDDATIGKRLVNATRELALAGRYQHQIVNDDVDQVVRKLEEAVR